MTTLIYNFRLQSYRKRIMRFAMVMMVRVGFARMKKSMDENQNLIYAPL